jgi:hypothetical protein
MLKFAIPAIAACALLAAPVIAQTTTTPDQPPSAPSAPIKTALNLTDVQAKQWIDKIVYSSDGKNVGEVGALQRDPSGNVTELHADIGGFLGIGETRVRVMPAQFHTEGDRVILNVTADQAKTLPQLPK